MYRKMRLGVHLWATILVLVGLLLSACGPTATPEVEEPTPTQAPAEAPTEAVVEEPTQAPTEAVVEEPTQAPTEPAPEAAKGGSLLYGFHIEPDSLDPAATYSSWNQLELYALYDPLVHWGPDKEFYPGLASSWDISDDGKTYTFKLREDVTFHDGTPFNADAVKFTLDRIGVAPTTIGKGASGLMGPYESTEVIDDYTVAVHFSEPFAAFLSSISDPFLSIMSPAAVEQWGDEDYGFHPVGTGPFMLKEWVPAEQITLEKNPDYNWAPSFFEHQGPPYLDEVTFRYIEEEATRLIALENGEVDIIDRPSELEVDRIKADDRFQVYSAETPMMPESILINTMKYPLDDVRVRQAILYAVDQPTMVQVLFNGVYPAAYGPLSPANPGYWAGAEDMYEYNPATAMELLDEAGWEPGADGIRVDGDGNPLFLDLLYPGGEFRARSYEFVQAQLREVGIDMSIQELEAAAMFEEAVAGNNALSQLQWGFSDPSGLRTFWHSSNEGTGFNWSHVRSEKLDELLAQGEATTDPAARAAIYEELQKIIMEEAYILPLYIITAYHASTNDVHGVMLRPTARHLWLYDVYTEE